MNTFTKVGGSIAGIVALIIAALAIGSWVNSPLRSLPKSARDVKEEYMSSGISDGTYFLKATIGREDFERFVTREKLPNRFKGNVPSDVMWWQSRGPVWWDSPRSVESGAYMSERGYRVLAGFSNGVLFYESTAW